MSNNNSTELTAWAREVRALHTELARPIEVVSDPRLRALKESWPAFSGDDWAPAELGTYYFGKIGVQQLPAPPIVSPAWAESHTFYTDDWPNTIGVEFQGRKWETSSGAPDWDGGPEAVAQLTITYYVAMQDFDDNGQERSTGDVWLSCEPSIEFYYLEPARPGVAPRQRLSHVTLDGARALEIALGDTLNTVRELV
jgi:hypothetical protein